MKITNELKKLLNEVRPYKKYVFVIAFTGILFGITYSRLALVIKDLFNDLTEGKPQQIFHSFPYALGISLTAAICRYFHIFLMNFVSEMVVQGLREKLQIKFMKLNLTFHGNFSAGSGGLMSRIMNDVRVIQDGLRMIADFFLHPILFIFLVGNLFYLDYKLTLFVFLVLPIVATFLRTISNSLLKYLPLGQENLEKITSIIKESLDGVRVIQSFGLESFMAKRLHSMGQEYLKNRKIIHSRIEAVGPVTEFLASAVVLSVLLYTSYQVAAGKSTP
jgi:ATP-binding cassette, subfamily B, bacterial MsbA